LGTVVLNIRGTYLRGLSIEKVIINNILKNRMARELEGNMGSAVKASLLDFIS
jgi:hypothetical protein